MTKCIVWKIGSWKQSKFPRDDSQLNCQILFKVIEDGHGAHNDTVKLNLESTQPQLVDWLKVIQQGRVVWCTVEKQINGWRIKKFAPFRGGPRVEGKEATMPDGSLPGQTRLT